MPIRLHNTLTRSREEFVPRDPGRVAMYVCGPTVYNDIHIGNARTFLSFDVIRRYLVWRGFQVDFVQNITDVDDKIINRAREENTSAEDVAARYTAAFLEAMDDLGVMKPDHQPRATEEIPQMIEMVKTLVETGHAYAVDGDVYFSVRSFPGYGKLSGRDIDDLQSGARVEVDERKRDPLDFALWKSAKPGEPHWTSPWGEGRPGWHLECSVMSVERLGTSFDIHGGGADLVFPHHENELAQSEAATGQPFARYWLHGGMLNINAEKMSKSLGNFLVLKDVLETYSAEVFRLLCLQTHYRSPLDFSDERLDEASASLDRLKSALANLYWAAAAEPNATSADGTFRSELLDAAHTAKAKFEAEMDDDFNTAGAVAALFEFAREANGVLARHPERDAEDTEVAARVADGFRELAGVLGLQLPASARDAGSGGAYPAEVVGLARALGGYDGDDADLAVDALMRARADARAAKDWPAADAIRDALDGIGLKVDDTPQGPRVVSK